MSKTLDDTYYFTASFVPISLSRSNRGWYIKLFAIVKS